MPVSKVKVGPGILSFQTPAVDFSVQILSATVSFSKDKEDDRKVLSGDTVAGAVTRSATLAFTILQDIAVPAGLVWWSWDNAGEEHPFRYVPNTVADQEILGTITVEPIDVGGDVDADAESEVEWDCVGLPTHGVIV
jgi:hypothetical protein